MTAEVQTISDSKAVILNTGCTLEWYSFTITIRMGSFKNIYTDVGEGGYASNPPIRSVIVTESGCSF